jgi:hypothetical protein
VKIPHRNPNTPNPQGAGLKRPAGVNSHETLLSFSAGE